MENKQIEFMLKGTFGRKRSRLAFDLSLADVAYMAGLVDGEGYICGTYHSDKYSYTLRLQVTNTNYGVMLWMQKKFGASIVSKGLPKKSTWKQAWTANFYSSYAKEVIRLIEPYLIIKKEQALLALQFPTDRSVQPQTRRQIYLALKEMNKLGP